MNTGEDPELDAAASAARAGAPDSDAELLSKLREGDTEAYVTLWTRHVGAALRLGHHLAPGHGEDLASDSFLAIFNQVTQTTTGPTEAFRAYLFTVMRNTATKWSRELGRVDTVEEVENANLEDGFAVVDESHRAQALATAFQRLPERWQRALWLSEVEEIKRRDIARELAIKPNAVSALLRRARTGLRKEWIGQQVPAHLLNDEQHAARHFSDYLMDVANITIVTEVDTHLSDCSTCSDLLVDLRTTSTRLKTTTLSAVGFTALGVALPATATQTGGVIAGGAAALFGVGGGLAASGVFAGGAGVFLIGGLIVASLLAGTFERATTADADTGTSADSSSTTTADAGTRDTNADKRPTNDSDDPNENVGSDSIDAPLPQQTGRGVTDDSISNMDFFEVTDRQIPPPPESPAERDPSTFTPTTPSEDLATGIATPPQYHGYFAPILAGTTDPAAEILIEANFGRSYQVSPEPDGNWEFDLRFMNTYPGMEYEYQVWAFTDAEISPVSSGTFTMDPVQVRGFEANPTMETQGS